MSHATHPASGAKRKKLEAGPDAASDVLDLDAINAKENAFVLCARHAVGQGCTSCDVGISYAIDAGDCDFGPELVSMRATLRGRREGDEKIRVDQKFATDYPNMYSFLLGERPWADKKIAEFNCFSKAVNSGVKFGSCIEFVLGC